MCAVCTVCACSLVRGGVCILCVHVGYTYALTCRYITPTLPPRPHSHTHSHAYMHVHTHAGKFYRFKGPTHPHTNMAKAALNMLTRTSAQDYAASSIFMNSVDTGRHAGRTRIHIYTYTYRCVYAYVHEHIHIYIYTLNHPPIRPRIHPPTPSFTHPHILTPSHVHWAHASMRSFTHTHTRTLPPGWINDENPLEKELKIKEENKFQTPIDEVDAMARVLDPALNGITQMQLYREQVERARRAEEAKEEKERKKRAQDGKSARKRKRRDTFKKKKAGEEIKRPVLYGVFYKDYKLTEW